MTMNISFSARNTNAFLSALWLFACNGKLTVVDDLDSQPADLDISHSGNAVDAGTAIASDHTGNAVDGGTDISTDRADAGTDTPVAVPEPGEFVPSGPLNMGCPCAATAALQPLLCAGREVENVENNVQLSADGGVVAFTLMSLAYDYEVAYWDGSTTRTTSKGSLIDLSATGERVLSGEEAGMRLLDIGGGSQLFQLYPGGGGRGWLSADGNTVTAFTYEHDTMQLARAHADTGQVEMLGDISGAILNNYVTPDASAVVGSTVPLRGSAYHVFRWSEQTGLTFDPFPADVEVWPEAVSNDGLVIAGRTTDAREVFRWSEADGYQRLAVASGHGTSARVSADGSVVLGSLDPDGSGGTVAFRWTQATGAVELTPGRASYALDMSEDGGVIIAVSWDDGQDQDTPPQATYVWDSTNGTRTLAALLAERNVDVSGWSFGYARVLSKNGKALVGHGYCGGVPTLYRAVLSD